ncbi:hypothetical protein, unlikely [Trypanosoma congolense IL3000]|uniref:Uncharacterized protein n=1 Tax=Trypanosoma congolense (strain IL3000) TaxID=1068625 RepID=F9W9F0_TRYCI|nr:hypothetical protein, unlikely [Trypanosoma congolense IL3000]
MTNLHIAHVCPTSAYCFLGVLAPSSSHCCHVLFITFGQANLVPFTEVAQVMVIAFRNPLIFHAAAKSLMPMSGTTIYEYVVVRTPWSSSHFATRTSSRHTRVNGCSSQQCNIARKIPVHLCTSNKANAPTPH